MNTTIFGLTPTYFIKFNYAYSLIWLIFTICSVGYAEIGKLEHEYLNEAPSTVFISVIFYFSLTILSLYCTISQAFLKTKSWILLYEAFLKFDLNSGYRENITKNNMLIKLIIHHIVFFIALALDCKIFYDSLPIEGFFAYMLERWILYLLFLITLLICYIAIPLRNRLKYINLILTSMFR